MQGKLEHSNEKLTSYVVSHGEKFRESLIVLDGFNLIHDVLTAFVTLVLRALVGNICDEHQ